MEQFIQHIQKFVEIPDEETEKILSYFHTLKLKKKENLLEEGHVCKDHYFVLKGCLRLFYINEKGVEQTTQFAIENWWLTDMLAFQQQKQSECYIQAVEDAEVLAISFDAQEQLLKNHPQLEKYFRLIFQRVYTAFQQRSKFQHDFSKEEQFYHFLDSQPDFIQRIPQYLIASYLGFTPEYLSEIRKKKRS